MGALDEIPATIRRLPLPDRLRLIEQATLEVSLRSTPLRTRPNPRLGTAKPTAVCERTRALTVDEFLAARLAPPPGVGPVSLQDIDRAIAEGAGGR
jgi:hypothetical protein